MTDLPSSSRTHSVSHSTRVVFKSSRTSSAASSEHACLVDDEEGDDEVVLLDARGQCETGHEDPTHEQNEITGQGDTGSTKLKRGEGPHNVAKKAVAHILRHKAQTGPETEGCGEYEPISSTEASLGHSCTSDDQPRQEVTHSHSFETSDDLRSYGSSHRTWFERRSCRWCLITIIVLIFVAAIVAPVITILQSMKPTPLTPVPQPPWLPWRNRTDDNGLPRILLWNTLAQRKRSLSQRIGAYAWNTTMPCKSYGADVEECEVTNNRYLLERSDAIVFYAEGLNRHDMPGSRAAPQMWVFWARSHLPPMDTAERHLNSSLSLPQVAHLFNWTTGHREDSDVVIPYGDFHCYSSFGKRHSRRSRLQPRREAAWLVDDCEWNRFKTEAFSASANDEGIIHIRLFPSCGASDCGTPSECVRYIARRYDFIVVSLEPVCFLSADELIYEAFNYDVVPVVLTPPGVKLHLPEHSVVSSAELYGERELARYLRSLLDDRKKYESYFAWKERCSVVILGDLLCPLCHALRETPVRRRPHPDVLEWWTRRTNCQGEPLFGLESGFIQVF
ncbi:hypothetical protein HPB52_008089 [Rhipicephalus sanguineus]|uniref:Fucosyltransferase n=1 Tax=Rhipicephalus sanguineus TaxID=34632 RepID=A0A9D4QLY5_RHISA|nr:hypothetical protein HPB52_008089 [Rhipicephalus sanguineus]